jgi:hypothetical protein
MERKRAGYAAVPLQPLYVARGAAVAKVRLIFLYICRAMKVLLYAFNKSSMVVGIYRQLLARW